MFEHKTIFFTGMLRGGSHPAPPRGAQTCPKLRPERGAATPRPPCPIPVAVSRPGAESRLAQGRGITQGAKPPLSVRLPGE